jgi:hypothetical protein
MPQSCGTETSNMSGTELLTPAEYARLRRCSLRTLDRERATRSGCPYVRLGGRLFYRRSDIDQFIATNVSPPSDERRGAVTAGTSLQIKINKRERLHCEWDIRRGKPLVRMRLKSTADGTMRATGPQIVFSDRHLPGVIAMLQDLQRTEGGAS